MTSTDHTPRSFTLTWLLDAPPETVFSAWTDPARLGSAGSTTPSSRSPTSRSSSTSASAARGGR